MCMWVVWSTLGRANPGKRSMWALEVGLGPFAQRIPKYVEYSPEGAWPSTCLCTFIYMCMYVHTVNIFHVLKHKCIPTFEIAFCLTGASPLSPWLFHHSSLNSNATPPDRPILTIMVVYSKHVPYFIPLSTSAFCNEALQLLSLTSEVCILLPWIQAGM